MAEKPPTRSLSLGNVAPAPPPRFDEGRDLVWMVGPGVLADFVDDTYPHPVRVVEGWPGDRAFLVDRTKLATSAHPADFIVGQLCDDEDWDSDLSEE